MRAADAGRQLAILPIMKPETCPTCETLISALRVIYTWATFRDGVALDPQHVAKLIKETLKATHP